ncbi:hypothetical protein LCGC14_1571900, partial [marine sediment metagenome]
MDLKEVDEGEDNAQKYDVLLNQISFYLDSPLFLWLRLLWLRLL